MDSSQSTVEYRPIPTFPGYRVGSDGSVWTSSRSRGYDGQPWRRMRTQLHPVQGYEVISLRQDNARRMRKVQVLMLESFCGPRPPGMAALHRNDQKTDNRIENLYWGTPTDNIRDAQHNERLKGPGRLTTPDEVERIRHLAMQGLSQRAIADAMSMNHKTVRYIILNKRHNGIDRRRLP